MLKNTKLILSFLAFQVVLCMSYYVLAADPKIMEDTKYFFHRSVYSDAYKNLPKILSKSDLEKYHSIYLAQRQHDYVKADAIIKTLGNNLLVSYMYYMRYVAKNYNPTYEELSKWLNEYSDHGVASIVYKMAQDKAKKASQKLSLKKPNSFYDRFVPLYMRHDTFKNIEPYLPNGKVEKAEPIDNSTTSTIRSHLKGGRTLNVKNILLSSQVIKTLDKNTYDYYCMLLGKSYFLDGDDNQAIFWARKSLKRNEKLFAESFSTMGLAYYRMKDYKNSAASFANLMKTDGSLPTDLVALGSYWYARVSLKNTDITNYYRGLEIASRYIYNFYGIIASEELGIVPNYTWNYLSLPAESIDILTSNRYSRRALALLQFGLLDWAEQELIFLANYDTASMNKSDEMTILNALIYMAQQVPMPALGLKFAGQQGMYYGLSHLSYPIFFVELKNGYELDPALLLAVMRRESAFYSGAVSGPGATGLMQIMPSTAAYVIKKYAVEVEQNNAYLTSPSTNIEIGQQYVKQLINVTNGNLIYTLGSFNAGSYHVDKWKKDSHRMVNDPLFFIESIPFRETRNYVKSVTTDYWIYQFKLGLENHALYSLVQGGQPIYYNVDQETINTLKNFSYKNF